MKGQFSLSLSPSAVPVTLSSQARYGWIILITRYFCSIILFADLVDSPVVGIGLWHPRRDNSWRALCQKEPPIVLSDRRQYVSTVSRFIRINSVFVTKCYSNGIMLRTRTGVINQSLSVRILLRRPTPENSVLSNIGWHFGGKEMDQFRWMVHAWTHRFIKYVEK